MKIVAFLLVLCVAGCNCDIGATFNATEGDPSTSTVGVCQVTELPIFNFFGTNAVQ